MSKLASKCNSKFPEVAEEIENIISTEEDVVMQTIRLKELFMLNINPILDDLNFSRKLYCQQIREIYELNLRYNEAKEIAKKLIP